MNDRIGTCSICCGAVVSSGYGRSSAHCENCGAVPKALNVIEMERPLVAAPMSRIEDSYPHLGDLRKTWD